MFCETNHMPTCVGDRISASAKLTKTTTVVSQVCILGCWFLRCSFIKDKLFPFFQAMLSWCIYNITSILRIMICSYLCHQHRFQTGNSNRCSSVQWHDICAMCGSLFFCGKQMYDICSRAKKWQDLQLLPFLELAHEVTCESRRLDYLDKKLQSCLS